MPPPSRLFSFLLHFPIRSAFLPLSYFCLDANGRIWSCSNQLVFLSFTLKCEGKLCKITHKLCLCVCLCSTGKQLIICCCIVHHFDEIKELHPFSILLLKMRQRAELDFTPSDQTIICLKWKTECGIVLTYYLTMKPCKD